MGPRPNIEVVREFVKNKWRTSGKVSVAALPKCFFTFEFTCREDITAVRSGGPWVIGKSSLALKKWSSNLDLSDSIFENVPVWVRLPGLPLEYWSEYIFHGIVSSFGELLLIETMTATRKRLVFARICVGVSQEAYIPSLIEIQSKLGSWVQNIEFETIPFACFKCRKSGHWAKKCPLNATSEKEKLAGPGKKAWKKKRMTQEKKGRKIKNRNWKTKSLIFKVAL